MNEDAQYTSRHEDASYDHVLKYTGVFGGVQGLKILVSLLRNKLTASLLGPAGMGLNAVYSKIGELINSATNFGISFSAVRQISETFEEGTSHQVLHFVRVVRTWCLWTGLLAAILCLCLSPLFSYMYFQHSFHHTPAIMLLSLMVLVMPIEAGECAILKGLRRLKSIALIEVLAALGTLVTTIPFYYLWGVHGVIYSLVLTQLMIAAVHLWYSVRIVPYHVSLFSMQVFRDGMGLIRLGIPYVLAAVAGAMVPTLIFGILESKAQIGLYNAGYSLMVIYAGMVFVALEGDYFPRLSSVNHDTVRMNHTINQQIDVCVLLVTPLLILLVLSLPIVVPLLLEHQFMQMVPMCVYASFYTFFRSIILPLEYTALAKGDSKMYLIMEVFYDALCVLLVYVFYHYYGLDGVGVALSLSVGIALVVVLGVYGWRYGCRIRRSTALLALFQFTCMVAAVALCTLAPNMWVRLGGGALIFGISTWRSFSLLSSQSNVVMRLLSRFRHSDDCDCR